jgi:hypothetical protein
MEEEKLKKANELKDSKELHERFVKIFSDVDKNNPINIDIDKEAWPIFLKVVEDYSHTEIMNAPDTEIVKKCISVKEIFFEQRNIITDGNGNPNIAANIKENPNFIAENPEVLEVIENMPVEQKIEMLIQEKSMDKFFDVFYNLNSEERDAAKREIIDNTSKITEETQRNIDANNITNKDIEAVTFNKIKKYSERKWNELSDDEQVDVLKICLYLSASEDNNMKKAVVAMLESVIPDKELRLIEQNPEQFVNNMLARISSKTKGNINTSKEIYQMVREETINEIKQSSIKTKISPNDIEEFNKNLEGAEKYQNRDLLEDFTDVSQLMIYENLKNASFLTRNDSAAIAGIYVLLQEKEKDNTITDRESDFKEVLNKVIFSENYVTLFGHYRNGNEINLEEVNSFTKRNAIDFNRYSRVLLKKINNGTEYPGDFEYHKIKSTTSKKEYKESLESHFEIDKTTLEAYVKLKETYNSIEDEIERRSANENIRNIEGFLTAKIQYSKFLTKGRLDLEKIQEYLNNKEEKKEPKKELLEKFVALKGFENTHLYKDKKIELVNLARENECFSYIVGDDLTDQEVFNNIEKVYEEEVSKYLDKKAFYTIYSEYASGKEFKNFSFQEKRTYLQALILAHSSENDALQTFADKFIYNLGSYGIDLLDNNGEISEEKLINFYSTYTATSIKSYDEIVKQRAGITGSKRRQFNKEILESANARLEYLEIDSENIQAISDSIQLPDGRKEEKFLGKEYYEALKKLNLENTYNVRNIVCMYNELLNIEDKNDNQNLVMSVMRKFITSDEYRMYFGDALYGNRIKEEAVRRYKGKTKTGVGEHGNRALMKLAANNRFEDPTGLENDENSIVGKFTERLNQMNEDNEKKAIADMINMFANIDTSKIPQENLDQMIKKRNLIMFIKEDGSGADPERINKFVQAFYGEDSNNKKKLQTRKKAKKANSTIVDKNLKVKIDRLYGLIHQSSLKIELEDEDFETFLSILEAEMEQVTFQEISAVNEEPIPDSIVDEVMEEKSEELINMGETREISESKNDIPITNEEIAILGPIKEMIVGEIPRQNEGSSEEKKEQSFIDKQVYTINGKKESQQNAVDYEKDTIPEDIEEGDNDNKSIFARIASVASTVIEKIRNNNFKQVDSNHDGNSMIEYKERKGFFSGIMNRLGIYKTELTENRDFYELEEVSNDENSKNTNRFFRFMNSIKGKSKEEKNSVQEDNNKIEQNVFDKYNVNVDEKKAIADAKAAQEKMYAQKRSNEQEEVK